MQDEVDAFVAKLEAEDDAEWEERDRTRELFCSQEESREESWRQAHTCSVCGAEDVWEHLRRNKRDKRLRCDKCRKYLARNGVDRPPIDDDLRFTDDPYEDGSLPVRRAGRQRPPPPPGWTGCAPSGDMRGHARDHSDLPKYGELHFRNYIGYSLVCIWWFLRPGKS